MADIELVIKIPEELKEAMDNAKEVYAFTYIRVYEYTIYNAIKNGTPLLKGHGDLIDVNRKITVPIGDEYEEYEEKTMTVREALNMCSDEGVTVADVIIPADKESEDKK